MNYLETSDYFILLALAEGAKHGGAINAQIIGDSVGAVFMKSSSLYDALKKLEKSKLIERTTAPAVKSHSKPYRLTDNGMRQLAWAVHMHERAVTLGKARLGRGY